MEIKKEFSSAVCLNRKHEDILRYIMVIIEFAILVWF
jgi:hypothetical protein